MATSESDDFESADEELNARKEHGIRVKRYTSIGSDSDDDVEFIPIQQHIPMQRSNNEDKNSAEQKCSLSDQDSNKSGTDKVEQVSHSSIIIKENSNQNFKCIPNNDLDKNTNVECISTSEKRKELKPEISAEESSSGDGKSKNISNKQERTKKQRKDIQSLDAKKLGATKIDKFPDVESLSLNEATIKSTSEGNSPTIQDSWKDYDEQNLQEELKNAEKQNSSKMVDSKIEGMKDSIDMPEELMSNLKFKDIFKPDGWEGLGDDIDLPDDLSDDKYQPVLNKPAVGATEQDSINSNWSGWGNWGVSSLLNTASASVSTFTSHVSHGLSLLEESIGVPDPADLVHSKNISVETLTSNDNESEELKNHSQYLPSSFGFSNFISGMSSITKLVESTGSKVISGGLDTLETLGKKTMEVLQEGDPGLKKKRAFFSNEADKPILSQILREAKEKADTEEKTMEEKELARKIHLESLFDDYQGLVHLEALEMLSKQCNMKIQQQLINLDGSELTYMQVTLDEVKELCDLEDDEDVEEDDEEPSTNDLKQKLQEAYKDLGVNITYDKLIDIWNELNSEVLMPEVQDVSHRELFQKAISALARFTANSVERFHKTAELLLIKERRSTVNEADSLVQLTKTLSTQIGSIANLYCNRLKELIQETNKSEITSNVTIIFLEATNASSYVQEAFRLLIPVLQVGAI